MTIRDKKSEALFKFAQYDAAAAEKGGYSNYSYWRSTLQVFFKNKVAVFLLFVLAALLLVMTGYLVDGSFSPFLYFRF